MPVGSDGYWGNYVTGVINGNYGTNLDGTGNPIHGAIIQLNGNDRFKWRHGDYFNYT